LSSSCVLVAGFRERTATGHHEDELPPEPLLNLGSTDHVFPGRGQRAAAVGMGSQPVALTLLGIGAMNSPRYRPAGLLAEWGRNRVAFDGGATADPGPRLQAWLVCDRRAELMPAIRRRARELDVTPEVAGFAANGVDIRPLEVRHTSHPAYGYLLTTGRSRVAWVPEFWEFPAWARDADIAFADAAGWERPIRFAGGVGGHASALDVADQARRRGVRRLVLAHVGRPSIRAFDRGELPPFGEFGVEGATYRVV
jgi:hypothetical protein